MEIELPGAAQWGSEACPMKPKLWFEPFVFNKYSQYGEDGIIARILEVIGANDKWCVEFGAWDGKYLSNVCNLIETQDYSAVMIEADSNKYKDLVNNYKNNPKVIPICRKVGVTENDKLDSILRETAIPKDFDLLSIDIDGNDYHIFDSVKVYRPKIVMVEFNPTIHTDGEFVQPCDFAKNAGCSLLSLYVLAKSKSYELVATTMTNGIFVDSKYYPSFGIDDNSPRKLRADDSAVTYLFSDQNGRILLSGFKKLPWHEYLIDENRLQIIPKILQKPGVDYGFFDKAMTKILLFFGILKK